MMTVAAALLAAAPFATALGSARLYNNCTNPVNFWTIGDTISGPTKLLGNVGLGASFTQDASINWIYAAQSADALMYHEAQTAFSYNLDGAGQVYYALTDNFGDAFSGDRVTLVPSDSSCPSIEWASGTPTEESTTGYACSSDAILTLTLCA